MLRRFHLAAFSFLEVMAAAGLVAVFLVGAFTANSRGLSMIRSAKETAGASKILQQRMETLRAASWTEVTDAATLKDFYATAADAGESCNQNFEKVTIAPWPSGVGPSVIQITRSTSGTTTVVSDNPDLVEGAAVMVTVSVSWTGAGNRARTRETCTVIANGGLGR
jgi:hypothetical protein